MIAIAPDGTRYSFPDDATQDEIDEFLKGSEVPEKNLTVEQEPFIPNIPPEAEWPRPGVGPMGPPVPEEVLTHSIFAIPGAVSATMGGINETISDLASQTLRNYGIEAYPGIPMVQMEEYPAFAGTGAFPGMPAWWVQQFAPEYAKAADVWAGRTLSGFTEPGMAVQLPFGALKPVAAKFGAEIVASIPETVQAIAEAEPGPEMVAPILDLGSSLAIGAGIGRQLARPTAAVTPTRTEVINAIKERRLAENRLREYQETEGRGLQAEASGGYRIKSTAGLEEETSLLLDQAIKDNPGFVGVLQILEDFGVEDPGNRIPFVAGLATRGPNGQIIPGAIRMSKAALNKELQQLDPSLRREYLARALNEEMIHSVVLPEEALAFWDTLTKAEQAARKKIYVGESGFEFNDLLLGHEALRQEIQRVMRLSPSEIIELKGVERIKPYLTELVARLIARVREWLGTEAAKLGQDIQIDVLTRLDDLSKKTDILDDVITQTQGMPVELTPFSVNRSKAEINRAIIQATGLISPREAIAALGDRPEYLRNAMEGILTERQKFMEGRNTVRDVAKKYLATLMSIQAGAVNLDTFKAAFPKFEARPEFLAYEKDGTPKVRPEDAAGWWFWTENGQKALNNLEQGILQKKDWKELIKLRSLFGLVGSMERAFEPLDVGTTKYAGSRAKYNMTNLPDALAALKALEKKVDPVLEWADDFQGIAEFKKPFMGQFMGFGEFPTVDSAELTYWITGKGDIRDVTDPALVEIHDAWATSQLYGSKNQKLVSARINEQFRQLQELGLARDLDPAVAGAILHHFLWDTVRGTKTTHAGLYKAIEAASINRRKSNVKAPEAMTAQEFGDPLRRERDSAVSLFAGKELPDGSLMYAREHAAGAMQMAKGKDGYLLVPKSVHQIDPMLFEQNELLFDRADQKELGLRFITVPEADAAKGDLFSAVQEKYGGLEPAAINRRKAAAQATAPLFEEKMVGGKEVIRGYQELAPTKKGTFVVTPEFVENFSREYFAGTTGPSFKEFTRKAAQRFGKVKPGALIEIFQDALKERLLNASGQDLAGMAQSLGLTRQLRIESREGKIRDIADPAPEMPPIVPGPQIPGVTRPEFVMASRAAFGPYKQKFKPSEPTVASQAQFTPAQRFRATVMAGIFDELMEQTKGRERWSRKEVHPTEDLADPKIQTKQPIYQDFSPADSNNPDFLGTRLVSDARGYGGEKVRRVEEGKLIEFSRKGIPVSATKRLTAIADKTTQKVYLVGTFRDGRRGPVLVDPLHPQLEAQPLETMMRRYNIISSVLIDEPVQKFKQEFKNLREYEAEFGEPAFEASKMWRSYGMPAAEEYEPPRARYELTEPITEGEAASIMDHIFSEVGVFEGPEDVILSIDALREQPRGEVISAYSKLANQILEKNPQFTDAEVINRLAEQVYANHIESPSSQAFIQRTISQGPAPTGEAAAIKAPEKGVAPEAERIPSAIEVEPGTPYRAFLESEYGKIFAGGEELGPRGISAGEAQPTVPPVRTLVTSQTPASINRLAKTGTQLFDKTVSDFFRWYSEWMNENLRRTGGEKAKLFADIVDKIIETERRRYGALTPWMDPARKEAGKMNQATTWAHRITPITERAAIANVVEAIEGKMPIPAFAKKLIDLVQRANYKIGLMYQQANPKFIATGLFQRNLTGFGYDIIRQGKGDVWDAWADGMAKANRIPVSTVKTFFEEWKKILDDPGVNEAMIEKVNQDFQRQFSRAITHVKVDVAGVPAWQQVIHSDVFNYLETAARRASHATAFRDFFPNTPNGRKMFTKLMEKLRRELAAPDQLNLTSLVRALQGHPTDNYVRAAIFRPGEPAGEAVKFVNQTLGNVFARLVLTGQMFVQPGENIVGAVPVFLGYRNYLEAIARLAKNDGFYRQLELQGSVNRVILDYSMDPHSPTRSLSKITGNVLSKVFMEQLLNELQEATAAATAHVVRERIVSGKLSLWERHMLPRTFRAMGFNTPKIQKMMRGNKELLDQFEGKAASFLTSGNKAIAEGSAIGSNRLFNSVFRFQSYPMMKANQLRKVWGGVGQAFKEGNAAEKAAAVYLLTRFMFGGVAQGALTAAITTLFYEGLHGVAIKKNEAKDETLQFVTETFLATMSGPLYLVYRGARFKGVKGLGEQAMRTFFPYSVVSELWNFSWGEGQYRDLDLYDRIRRFVKMKIPGTKALTTGLSVVGLSQENQKLNAAMNAFYRWRLQEKGMSGTPPVLWEDESKEFRIQLKKAVEFLKEGDIDSYGEALTAAFDASTKQGQLKDALAAKTVLVNPKGKKLTPEEMESLRNRIGDEYVDVLVDYDELIQRAAEKIWK